MTVDAGESTEPIADGGDGQREHGAFLREMPFLVLIALALALLIKSLLVQAFYIPSGSMENTLHVGDRVLVNKLLYDVRPIHRGEIVVFKGPESWAPEVAISKPTNPVAKLLRGIGSAIGVAPPGEKDFIKRVVGVAGDHVVCCDARGRVTVNGVALTEPYLYPGNRPSSTPFDIIVPAHRLWVMGDHRDASADSRYHLDDGNRGTIPVGNVVGRAFVRVWPSSRWGTMPVPTTFHQPHLVAGPAPPGREPVAAHGQE